MFASFMNVCTRINMVSCQGVYQHDVRHFVLNLHSLINCIWHFHWFCGSQVFLVFCKWLFLLN